MTPKISPEDLHRRGFQALIDALGVSNAIRFMQQLVPGKGNYTAERHQWLPTDLDEVLKSLASRKAAAQPALRESTPAPADILAAQFSEK